jgi:exodeoxyribonuclease VII small subunit
MDRASPQLDLSFDEAFTALEQVVAELERGDLGLEASIDRFERGMQLARHCRELLGKAQLQVRQLLADAEGDIQLVALGEPFDDE